MPAGFWASPKVLRVMNEAEAVPAATVAVTEGAESERGNRDLADIRTRARVMTS